MSGKGETWEQLIEKIALAVIGSELGGSSESAKRYISGLSAGAWSALWLADVAAMDLKRPLIAGAAAYAGFQYGGATWMYLGGATSYGLMTYYKLKELPA
jgi:hypothetical protein